MRGSGWACTNIDVSLFFLLRCRLFPRLVSLRRSCTCSTLSSIIIAALFLPLLSLSLSISLSLIRIYPHVLVICLLYECMRFLCMTFSTFDMKPYCRAWLLQVLSNHFTSNFSLGAIFSSLSFLVPFLPLLLIMVLHQVMPFVSSLCFPLFFPLASASAVHLEC